MEVEKYLFWGSTPLAYKWTQSSSMCLVKKCSSIQKEMARETPSQPWRARSHPAWTVCILFTGDMCEHKRGSSQVLQVRAWTRARTEE